MNQHQALSAVGCRICGYQNPSEATICLNCTASLGRACPTCGNPVAAGGKFCGNCGTRLTEAPPRPAGPVQTDGGPEELLTAMPTGVAAKIKTASVKQTGERRNVTVMLVELISHSAAASHYLDSESIYLSIDEAVALLVEVVYQYDGTVDKFTGDGLMILFGAPLAHENDPELAIRAALEMFSALAPFNRRLQAAYGFEIQLRIGLSTGEVIAGRMGNDIHMEYTVVGAPVNRAAGLKDRAQPGTILAGPETYRRTRHIFEFEADSIATGPDSPGSSEHFRVVKVLDSPDLAPDDSRPQAPMVGRGEELARLEQVLETVRLARQRRIVLLTGEVGVGKSRLVAEFRNKLAQLDVRVYQAQCHTYTRTRPLWLVAEMLRQVMGLVETDPANLQHAAMQRYLQQLNLAQEKIGPYLANVLGLAQVDQESEHRLAFLDGAMLQRQIHLALRRVFLAEAEAAPTVLIFEDLNWIDQASQDFLEYLVQTTSEAPLMLMLVSRQDESQTSLQSLLATVEREIEQLVALHLDVLADAESQRLVKQVIKAGTPDAQAIRKKIVERAAGNPFYVGEIIRILIDRGGLTRESPDKDWQVTPQASEQLKAVPGTIKDSILIRFDYLPEGLRRTSQLAAVLGAAFPTSLLRSLSELDARTLALHLNELEQRQFLLAEPFNSEAGYVFQHALVQEVVYSTLLKRDRRQIHNLVAEAIEQSETWRAHEKSELLAYHYFRGVHPVKATPYLVTTADQAERRCAYQIAIEQYRRVIDLLPDQPDERPDEFFQVRIGLGRSLKFVGEFTVAGQLLSESLQLLWTSNLANRADTLWPVLVEILRQLADVRQREGSYEQAMDYLESGLTVLGETGAAENPMLWCQLVERQAWVHFRQGRLETAFTLANAAVERFSSEKINEPILQAKILNTLGGICWQQGQREQAIDYTQRSLELYQQIGYSWGVATAYNNLGILYDVLGNWAKAAAYHRQAYDLQQSIGDIEGLARSLDNLGILYMIMGQHDTARRELETSLTIRRKLGDRYGLAQSYASLAELAVLQENSGEALANAQAALELADTIESPEIQVYAHWILALVQAEPGELAPGQESAEQALQLARAAGFVEGEVDCLRVLGILQARAKEYQAAQAHFDSSAELALQQNDPFRQGLALLESGRAGLLRLEPDQPDRVGWQAKAVVALNQAIEKFESLGAAYHQELAQTILRELQDFRPTEE